MQRYDKTKKGKVGNRPSFQITAILEMVSILFYSSVS